MQRWFLSLGTFVLMVGASNGCTRSSCRAQDPGRVLRDYAAAVRAGDAERAWGLLSDETKRTTTFEAFQAELKRDPEQARELADLMERPIGPPVVTAQLGAPDGEPIQMVQLDGEWHLRLSSVDPYSQASPLAALRSFVRATTHRRYDVLLRLAPSQDRKLLDEDKLRKAFEGTEREEIATLSQAIEAGLGHGRLEVLGDRATFDLGAGSTVELVRENGNWCIENYRP
jgi:hypothetical protein